MFHHIPERPRILSTFVPTSDRPSAVRQTYDTAARIPGLLVRLAQQVRK